MKVLILFILFNCSVFCQSTEKKGYLFDETGKEISQAIFDKQAKTGNYTWTTYETKDSINARLVLLEEYGKIDALQKQQIIDYLKEISGVTLSEEQTIIINFSFLKDTPNQRHCIDYYTSIKSYRNYFKNKKQFAQFYISQKGFSYRKDFVFEDKDDLIRKLFFGFGNSCTYVIIRPDGRFFKNMGEHHQDKIPEKAAADW